MMLKLIQRQLLLYFRNRSGVFFSMLGALITFIVFVVFLKENTEENWKAIDNSSQLLNLWFIGGMLPVVGLTTTFSNLGQLVEDRERSVRQDLLMAGISVRQLDMAYLIGAILVSFLMQVFVLVVMIAYFSWTDDFELPQKVVLFLPVLLLVNSVLNGLLSFMLLKWVKRVSVLEQLATIIGSLSGFLVGNYIPIGMFPEVAQTIIKFTPPAYLASLFRQYLTKDTLAEVFEGQVELRHSFEVDMGIRLSWSETLSQQETWWVIAGCTVGLFLLFYLQTGQQGGIIKKEKR